MACQEEESADHANTEQPVNNEDSRFRYHSYPPTESTNTKETTTREEEHDDPAANVEHWNPLEVNRREPNKPQQTQTWIPQTKEQPSLESKTFRVTVPDVLDDAIKTCISSPEFPGAVGECDDAESCR